MKHTFINWLAPTALLTWASCGKQQKTGATAITKAAYGKEKLAELEKNYKHGKGGYLADQQKFEQNLFY